MPEFCLLLPGQDESSESYLEVLQCNIHTHCIVNMLTATNTRLQMREFLPFHPPT